MPQATHFNISQLNYFMLKVSVLLSNPDMLLRKLQSYSPQDKSRFVEIFSQFILTYKCVFSSYIAAMAAVILSLRDSSILHLRRKVILYSPPNCAKRNFTREANITAKQYHSPQANITERNRFCLPDKSGFFHGAPGRILTAGLPLRRRSLYTAGLRGRVRSHYTDGGRKNQVFSADLRHIRQRNPVCRFSFVANRRFFGFGLDEIRKKV